MRKIDTEAHFYNREYQDYLFSRKETPREEIYKGYVRLWYEPHIWEPHGLEIEDRLLDVGKGRLENMDRAGIDMQVLSLSTPGCEQFSPAKGMALSRKTNEALSETVLEETKFKFEKINPKFEKIDNKAAAYICINKTCKPPTVNSKIMMEYLKQNWK